MFKVGIENELEISYGFGVERSKVKVTVRVRFRVMDNSNIRRKFELYECLLVETVLVL